MTEPTDAELDAVLCKHWPAFSMQATLVRMWVRAAMRDAIAKWGTPAPVGVEPYGWHYWNIAGTSVLHLGRSSKLDADIGASREHPEAHHVVPLYTTPQPTKAQAGTVPLTDEQIVGVLHSIPINAAPSHHIAFARAIEQAHGIKGAQHGTE